MEDRLRGNRIRRRNAMSVAESFRQYRKSMAEMVRRYRKSEAERVRRYHKPYDGPPPVDTMDAFLASKGFKPQALYPVGFENLDPAALAYMPERIRTRSSLATSGTLNPPTSSTSSATTAQVKGGTVPNKSSETLVENLKFDELHISNTSN